MHTICPICKGAGMVDENAEYRTVVVPCGACGGSGKTITAAELARLLAWFTPANEAQGKPA